MQREFGALVDDHERAAAVLYDTALRVISMSEIHAAEVVLAVEAKLRQEAASGRIVDAGTLTAMADLIRRAAHI